MTRNGLRLDYTTKVSTIRRVHVVKEERGKSCGKIITFGIGRIRCAFRSRRHAGIFRSMLKRRKLLNCLYTGS